MRILVTGGAGFIGSHIVEELSKDYEIVVLDDLSTGSLENISSFMHRISFVNGDIRDRRLLEDICKDVDVILHQAAIPSVPRSVENPVETSEVNVMGTLNVLEAARKRNVRRVVLASSSSVYGEKEDLPKKESQCPSPKSPYASAKCINEQHAREYYELYGLETIALRYFNVYGPRQNPNSEYAAVIPAFISRLLNDQPPIIYGDGRQSRDFTFVKDVVEANRKAMETKNTEAFGKAINIATGKETSILELARILSRLTGKDIQPIFENPRKGDVRRSVADISLAKSILNWEPRYSLREGLEITVEWFKRTLS